MKSEELRQKSHLQFITHYTERYTYLDSAQMALEGGCRWIQLRMKECPLDEIEKTAIKIKEMCQAHNAVFIIDDHVELAKSIGADGVHLGQNDMPVAEARDILGQECIIGGTANTFEQIAALAQAGADYIGCGPYRYTSTKKNLSPILGLNGYREIVAKMQKRMIQLPIVAIGGITKDDIPPLMQTCLTGIALSGSILRAENPTEEMKIIINQINRYGKTDHCGTRI